MANKTVIIVHHQAMQAQLWQLAFQSQGFDVVQKSPRKNLLQGLTTDLPLDLLLLSMGIELFNPYAFCSDCRRKFPGLPIILTQDTKIHPQERNWAISQGATDLLQAFHSTAEIANCLEEVFSAVGGNISLDKEALDSALEIFETISKNPLADLCQQMRYSASLPIENRRWQLRVFENCFLGSDAVTWIAAKLNISRSKAVQVGQTCLNHGYFHHVLDDQEFADGRFFYRFRDDGSPEPKVMQMLNKKLF